MRERPILTLGTAVAILLLCVASSAAWLQTSADRLPVAGALPLTPPAPADTEPCDQPSPPPPTLTLRLAEGNPWVFGDGNAWCLTDPDGLGQPLEFVLDVSGLDPGGAGEHAVRGAQFFLRYTSASCDGALPAFDSFTIAPGHDGESPFQYEVMPVQHSEPIIGGTPGTIGYIVSIPLDDAMSACDNALATLGFTPTSQGRLTLWFRDPLTLPTTMLADDAGGSIASPELILAQPDEGLALTIVADWTPPQVIAPADVQVACLAGLPAIAGTYDEFVAQGGSAVDNCTPVASLVFAAVDGELVGGACGGTLTRTYTVTDECGNSVQVDQVITVDDNTPPVASAPPVAAAQCADELPSPATDYAAYVAIGGGASDNCTAAENLDVSSFDGVLIGGGCGGTLTRTYTFADECGNLFDVEHIILVSDTIAPVVTAPTPIEVECLNDIPPPAANFDDFAALGGTATDNCSAAADLVVTASDGVLIGDTLIRTYRLTDECGNHADIDQIITVVDSTDPIAAAPDDLTVQCTVVIPAAAQNYANFVAQGGTAWDNCSAGINLTISAVDGPLSGGGCGGTVTRTYTIADESGNSVDVDQVFTVNDTIPPTINCPSNITIELGASEDPAQTGQASASDNCSAPGAIVLTYTDDVVPGDCGDVYTIVRTWRATDGCNNFSTCEQTIRVGLWTDCNTNGIPDGCDLAGGFSQDCNSNGIPDECDIAAGTAADCNENGVPDACDLASGFSQDCTLNGIPDECEPDCNTNGVADSCDIAAGTSSDCNSNGVPDECDLLGGGEDCNGNGVPDECDLAVGFSVDCNNNGVPDECDLASGTSQDCNSNDVPDECDIAGGISTDCNHNGVPDDCDLSAGTSPDCNTNGIPDECDITSGVSNDCNANGIPDECDLAGGSSQDCNSNGVPDECDIAAGASADCNTNGVPDECDIAVGFSEDCTANGIPDECEPDCNVNGVADTCDIAAGTSVDCNANNIPDECEPDCNGNGIADSCDIDTGTALDCNGNGVPDECDIAAGTSADCQPNGIPDDCEWEAYAQPGRGGAGRAAECQWPDQQVHGGLFMVALDWDAAPTAADSFTFSDAVRIDALRWWGGYRDACQTACEPADHFVVTLYTNDLGMADQVLATYDLDHLVARTATGLTIPFEDGYPEYEYNAELSPPLTVEAGRRIWVEIRNRVEFPCVWAWETAPLGDAGNGTALHDVDGDGYAAGDLAPFDLACCVIGIPLAQDCNANGVDDIADINSGFSQDCQGNGIPDECEDDRNFNDSPDDCDIGGGLSWDSNFNGVPDEADCLTRLGDLDGDCDVDSDDYALFVNCMDRSGADLLWACPCADIDSNGMVDAEDYMLFAALFGTLDPNCRVIPGDACPDTWSTGDSVGQTYYDFSEHGPIPADFFAPGSDPFDGVVVLVGRPADPTGVFGSTDTRILHGAVEFDPQSGIAETTVDVITLDLVSYEPITVSYDGGARTEDWLVVVGLSSLTPQSGSMLAELDEPGANAGRFAATVYVQPVFLFVNLNDLLNHVLPECVQIRILDTGESLPGIPALPPIDLSFGDQPFVRTAAPYILEQISVPECAQGNFVTGIEETAALDGRTMQQLTCTSHETPEEAHYFCPSECEGPDVCLYTYLWAVPIGGCAGSPSFPPAILGQDCEDGDCPRGFEFKMIGCPGGGMLLVCYGNPSCVTRESLCQGACWNSNGDCVLSTDALCGGTYVHDTSCDEQPKGACCKPDGSCIVVPQEVCGDQGGSYQGDGTSCDPSPCAGACCQPDGTCSQMTQAACNSANGSFMGANTDCDPNPCAGACCQSDGTCTMTTQQACTDGGGVFRGYGVDCDENTCRGACCQPDGTCTLSTQDECAAIAGGEFQGMGTTCAADTCRGACCREDGSCTIMTQDECIYAGGEYQGHGSTCEENTCRGACWGTDGMCTITTRQACESAGGAYQGNGSECSTTTGACCLSGGVCIVTSQECCTHASGVYRGDNLPCEPDPCAVGACCHGDGTCSLEFAIDCNGANDTYLGDNEACVDHEPEITTQPEDWHVCDGGDATFTIEVTAGSGALHYQWKRNGTDVGGDSNTLTLNNVAAADSGDQVLCEVKDACGTVTSDTATLYVFAMEFVEDTSQSYGFDSYTNRNNNPVIPYKSVWNTGIDTATLNITPGAPADAVTLVSSNTGSVTVTPEHPSGGATTVRIAGHSNGSADIEAQVGDPAQTCATMNTKAYDFTSKTVAVILVHEENDDVQVIPLGQGLPNTLAITAGSNGTLDTAPSGDDQIVGNAIRTGADGVCNTTAAGDDVQVIPINHGKPNEVCVQQGHNGFADSSLEGDDAWAGGGTGGDINTGPDGICNTPAADTDIMSTDINTAALQTYLRGTVYFQSVIMFTVTRLPAVTVNFDLNRDGNIDVNNWMSAEMRAVRDAAGNSGYDHNIFLVDNPSDGSGGFSNLNQRYVYVHVDVVTTPGIGGVPNQVCAHELGHAQGLSHVYESGQPATDVENLMDPFLNNGANKWRLRKGQWDSLNP